MASEDHTVIWGVHPVREFVVARPDGVSACWILPSFGRTKRQARLMKLVKDAGLALNRVESLAGLGLPRQAAHQGIAASVRRVWERDLDSVLSSQFGQGLFVVCDQLEDPGNLGAVVRASVAMGAHAILVPKLRSAVVGGTVCKASAGALVHARLCPVGNLSRALESLKAAGVWVAGLTPEGPGMLWEADFTMPMAIVVGKEGKGLRKGTKAHCDMLLSIPMDSGLASLNVATALAMALYEAVRQRNASRGE